MENLNRPLDYPLDFMEKCFFDFNQKLIKPTNSFFVLKSYLMGIHLYFY